MRSLCGLKGKKRRGGEKQSPTGMTSLPPSTQGCVAMPNSTGTAGSLGGRGAAWNLRQSTGTRDPSSTSSALAVPPHRPGF